MAEKVLEDLMDRGERKILVARRMEAEHREHEFTEEWNNWYGAVNAGLERIYPTMAEFEVVRRSFEKAATWPMRVRLTIDGLRNLKDTLRHRQPAPQQERLIRFLREHPAVKWAVGIVVGTIVVIVGSWVALTLQEMLKK